MILDSRPLCFFTCDGELFSDLPPVTAWQFAAILRELTRKHEWFRDGAFWVDGLTSQVSTMKRRSDPHAPGSPSFKVGTQYWALYSRTDSSEKSTEADITRIIELEQIVETAIDICIPTSKEDTQCQE